MHICEYGCGKEAKYQLKNGKWCCCEHYNKCEAIRKKNSEGGKLSYQKGRKKIFTEEHRIKSKQVSRQKAIKNAFKFGSSISNAALKKYLIEDIGIPNKCALCSISQWRGKNITLELDHIDGNSSNNELSNLRLLCPNCHSQTDTFRGKTINKGKMKITDDMLLNAIAQTKNVRQALLSVGLAPKGANYARIYKLKNIQNARMAEW